MVGLIATRFVCWLVGGWLIDSFVGLFGWSVGCSCAVVFVCRCVSTCASGSMCSLCQFAVCFAQRECEVHMAFVVNLVVCDSCVWSCVMWSQLISFFVWFFWRLVLIASFDRRRCWLLWKIFLEIPSTGLRRARLTRRCSWMHSSSTRWAS